MFLLIISEMIMMPHTNYTSYQLSCLTLSYVNITFAKASYLFFLSKQLPILCDVLVICNCMIKLLKV